MQQDLVGARDIALRLNRDVTTVRRWANTWLHEAEQARQEGRPAQAPQSVARRGTGPKAERLYVWEHVQAWFDAGHRHGLSVGNRQRARRVDREGLAALLQITPKTLANRLSEGSLPRPAEDGSWLVADVADFLARRRAGLAPAPRIGQNTDAG